MSNATSLTGAYREAGQPFVSQTAAEPFFNTSYTSETAAPKTSWTVKVLHGLLLFLESFSCYIGWATHTEFVASVASFTVAGVRSGSSGAPASIGAAASLAAGLITSASVVIGGVDVICNKFLAPWFYPIRAAATVLLLLSLMKNHAISVFLLGLANCIFWTTQIAVIRHTDHKERHKWGFVFGLFFLVTLRYFILSREPLFLYALSSILLMVLFCASCIVLFLMDRFGFMGVNKGVPSEQVELSSFDDKAPTREVEPDSEEISLVHPLTDVVPHSARHIHGVNMVRADFLPMGISEAAMLTLMTFALLSPYFGPHFSLTSAQSKHYLAGATMSLLCLFIGMVISPILSGVVIFWIIMFIIGIPMFAHTDNVAGLVGYYFILIALPQACIYMYNEIRVTKHILGFIVVFLVTFFILICSALSIYISYEPFLKMFGGIFARSPAAFLWTVLVLILILPSYRLIQALIMKQSLRQFIVIKLRIPLDIILTLGTVGVITLVMLIVWGIGLPRPTSTTSTTFTVAVYNVRQSIDSHGNEAVRAIRDCTDDLNSQVIGFTESDTMHFFTQTIDTTLFVGELESYHTYRGLRGEKSSLGCSLLSWFPLSDQKAEVMPYSNKKNLVRPFISSVLTIGLSHVVVQAVTVEWSGTSEEDSMDQILYIIDRVNEVSSPIVLLGTFNAEPASQQIQTLLAGTGLSLANDLCSSEGVYEPTCSDGRCIDLIFYRNLTIMDCDVNPYCDDTDHYPVKATFVTPM
ncbi:hypothetical protein Pelo_12993 [Pelomyxa schiedti]|nr:hypothetical protein Pelo_12993 [Pelomyxa schiedti]